MRERINSIIKIQNRILAIPTALAAIPPNPKTAAIMAIIKNAMAQPNIKNILIIKDKFNDINAKFIPSLSQGNFTTSNNQIKST